MFTLYLVLIGLFAFSIGVLICGVWLRKHRTKADAEKSRPTLKELTSPLSQDERKRIWDEVQGTLAVFEGAQGFEVIHKVIVAAGSAA